MNIVHPFQRTVRFYAQNQNLPREYFENILRDGNKFARFTPRTSGW
jgi:hypothetical protein